MIVDAALYENGVRRAGAPSMEEIAAAATGGTSFAWVGVNNPTPDEMHQVQRAFGLHDLAIEDALLTHERPRVEVFGRRLTVVLRPARYIEEDERVEFGQITLLVSDRYVIGVRNGDAVPLRRLRSRLEADPERLVLGPGSVVHAVFDEVVDAYMPVIAGIQNDVDEVEEVVFSDRRESPTERIYYLKREVLEMSKATKPLSDSINSLRTTPHAALDPALAQYFADVTDDLMRVEDAVQTLREMLNSALEANLTQVAIRQNEDMRRMSAWVAILAVPTMIAGIYGMNFEHMPELHSTYGYPIILGIIATICLLMFRAFRRSGWL